MIVTDNRPMIKEYAVLSQHVYGRGDIALPSGWQELEDMGGDINQHENGRYVYKIYLNQSKRHLVLASRGTIPREDLKFDLAVVFFKPENAYQKHRVEDLTACIDKVSKYAARNNFQLSFTGHSLGGWYSELAMAIIYLYQTRINRNSLHVNAVTFDSPGAYQACVSWLCYNIKKRDRYRLSEEYIRRLAENWIHQADIANVMFPANIVNTSCQHTQDAYYAPTLFEGKGTTAKHSLYSMIRYSEFHRDYALTLSRLVPVDSWHFNKKQGCLGRSFGVIRQNKATNRFHSYSHEKRYNLNEDGSYREEVDDVAYATAQYRQLDFPSEPEGRQWFSPKIYNLDDVSILESKHFNIQVRKLLKDLAFAKRKDKDALVRLVASNFTSISDVQVNRMLSFELYTLDEQGCVLYDGGEWLGVIAVPNMTVFYFRWLICRGFSRFNPDKLERFYCKVEEIIEGVAGVQ